MGLNPLFPDDHFPLDKPPYSDIMTDWSVIINLLKNKESKLI
jgi:hypothetical protein